MLLSACKTFHLEHKDYVYVAARQVYLHDRVAAVSNRVGQVTNGEALEVIERGKRFIKVRTPKGEVGWLEEHAVIDDKLFAEFQDLAKMHAQDPVVANAELRDDLYLHVSPGRESPHFLLVPGSAKVQLIERGTVEKAPPPGTAKVPKPASKVPAAASSTSNADSAAAAAAVAQVPMEDWWLIRDAQGHTGWLLAGRLDVDVPDEVGAYAEGQRMVGAYPLTKVTDFNADRGKRAEAGKEASRPRKAGKASESDAGNESDVNAGTPKEFTEYVTVLTPPRSGLPFDFDQVRVFVWSLNHHRYETAFRLHGIRGYLPVKITRENVGGQNEPVFSFQIADGTNVAVDPDTGVTKPVAPRTLAFRLEGNLVKRTGADQNPIVLSHDTEENPKKKSGKKKR